MFNMFMENNKILFAYNMTKTGTCYNYFANLTKYHGTKNFANGVAMVNIYE